MPDLLSIDASRNTLGLRDFTRIFKVDTVYYVTKIDGTTTAYTVAQDAIQAGLNVGGDVYLAGGATGAAENNNYNLTSAFTGFTFPADTHLIAHKNAKIRVDTSYSGYVFTATDIGWKSGMSNVYIEQAGVSNKNWSGIKLTSANSTGTAFFVMNNCYIYKPDVGIELETTHADGYVNGCRFNDVTVHGPKTAGVLFDYTTNGDIAANGFINTQIQMDSDSVVGFKDVANANNVFVQCYVWDAVATATEWKIAATATDTVIVGGGPIGFTGSFIDLGQRTQVIGPFKGIGPYQVSRPDLAKQGAWYGSAPASADGILNGRLIAVAVGTGTSSTTNDSTGIYRTYDTNATINSIAGHRIDQAMLNRLNHAYFKTSITTGSNIADTRIFAGLVASAAAPVSAADPLNALSGVALWYDSAVNANWRRLHNDSSGASVSDDTGVAVATSTNYPVEIYANTDDTKFRFVFNGTLTDISTDIPASTTQLGMWVYIENTTGASRTMRDYYIIIRNDK